MALGLSNDLILWKPNLSNPWNKVVELLTCGYLKNRLVT